MSKAMREPRLDDAGAPTQSPTEQVGDWGYESALPYLQDLTDDAGDDAPVEPE